MKHYYYYLINCTVITVPTIFVSSFLLCQHIFCKKWRMYRRLRQTLIRNKWRYKSQFDRRYIVGWISNCTYCSYLVSVFWIRQYTHRCVAFATKAHTKYMHLAQLLIHPTWISNCSWFVVKNASLWHLQRMQTQNKCD